LKSFRVKNATKILKRLKKIQLVGLAVFLKEFKDGIAGLLSFKSSSRQIVTEFC